MDKYIKVFENISRNQRDKTIEAQFISDLRVVNDQLASLFEKLFENLDFNRILFTNIASAEPKSLIRKINEITKEYDFYFYFFEYQDNSWAPVPFDITKRKNVSLKVGSTSFSKMVLFLSPITPTHSIAIGSYEILSKDIVIFSNTVKEKVEIFLRFLFQPDKKVTDFMRAKERDYWDKIKLNEILGEKIRDILMQELLTLLSVDEIEILRRYYGHKDRNLEGLLQANQDTYTRIIQKLVALMEEDSLSHEVWHAYDDFREVLKIAQPSELENLAKGVQISVFGAFSRMNMIYEMINALPQPYSVHDIGRVAQLRFYAKEAGVPLESIRTPEGIAKVITDLGSSSERTRQFYGRFLKDPNIWGNKAVDVSKVSFAIEDAAQVAKPWEGKDYEEKEHRADRVEAKLLHLLPIPESRIDRIDVPAGHLNIKVTWYKNDQGGKVPFLRVGPFIIVDRGYWDELPNDVKEYPLLIVKDTSTLPHYAKYLADRDMVYTHDGIVAWAGYSIGAIVSMIAYADLIKDLTFVDFGAGFSGITGFVAHALGAKKVILIEDKVGLINTLNDNLRFNFKNENMRKPVEERTAFTNTFQLEHTNMFERVSFLKSEGPYVLLWNHGNYGLYAYGYSETPLEQSLLKFPPKSIRYAIISGGPESLAPQAKQRIEQMTDMPVNQVIVQQHDPKNTPFTSFNVVFDYAMNVSKKVSQLLLILRYRAISQEKMELETPPDSAMHHEIRKGGIDLRAEKMNLQVKNGGGIKFHLDPAMLKQLQDASGFIPVIISIEPMMNLRKFLEV